MIKKTLSISFLLGCIVGVVIPLSSFGETALTSDDCLHWRPQWSPDGNWIVYEKFLDDIQIYKVPSSGGDEFALTSESDSHTEPQWSPDGNWIVYEKGYSHIYKVSSSGGTEIALTNGSQPQWSPDGNWIVYQKHDATGYAQIYKVSSAGGSVTALTSDNYEHWHPQWSPDGNWIVYQKAEEWTDPWEIYKISSSGGTEIALTSDGFDHNYPQWSPDGNWIVYNKDSHIYKVSSSGGTEIALTSGVDLGIFPQWSPDGNWIVYNAIGNICKVPSSGGSGIVLASGADGCAFPQWSPDGNWIVYEKKDATGYCQIYKTPSTLSYTYTFQTDPNTNPPKVKVDESWYDTPKSFEWESGSTHEISAPDQSGYEYDYWSDGGAQTHNITVGSSNETITAYFNKIVTYTFQTSPNTNPPKIKVDGNWCNTDTSFEWEVGSSHQISAPDQSGYEYDYWSDGGAQTHNITVGSSNKTFTAYFTIPGIEEIFMSEPPKKFYLSQNSPNPVRSVTAIQFGTPKETYITLTVYDVTGKKVRTLTDGAVIAGHHIVRWDSRDSNGKEVTLGIYFYRLETGKFKATKKLTILR